MEAKHLLVPFSGEFPITLFVFINRCFLPLEMTGARIDINDFLLQRFHPHREGGPKIIKSD